MHTAIRQIIGLTLITGTVFVSGFVAIALENQFTVTQTVTGLPDTTPPSVPTSVLANAVSTTQIDVSWTASTDDTIVSGYRVFRDNAFIATTTGVFYSDTGLSASTTYLYTVSAFDGVPNESLRSATSSATTFAPPSSASSGGVILPLQISQPVILVGDNTLVISWGTNYGALSTVSWGETSDYELGTLTETIANVEHKTKLENLLPGTLYHVRIIARDAAGFMQVVDRTITTTLQNDTTAPSNVRDLYALSAQGGVKLGWTNPVEKDFDFVRIVRSSEFYPRDPFDGVVVFEGRNESFLDTETLEGNRYYYSVFSRDRAGNYSSGAVVLVSKIIGGEEPQEPIEGGEVLYPEISTLSFADFSFSQGGENISFTGNEITLNGEKVTHVYIPYGAVPEVLKTIAITIHDKDAYDRTFTFLLRVDSKKELYEALIGAFGEEGVYPFEIKIFDFKNQYLKKLEGVWKVSIEGGKREIPITSFGLGEILSLLVVFLALILALIIARRVLHI